MQDILAHSVQDISTQSAGVSDTSRGLLEEWRAFVEGRSTASSVIRPVTLQAWARCRDLGIDPSRLQYRFLSEEELAAKRAMNAALVNAARPYLEHLSLALSGRPNCVALSDADGWVIDLLERPEGAFGGRATGIFLGSSWNERDIGNNGIGTALALGEPTLVYGVEHYAMQYHSAHCLGVPIRVNGRVVGCLDVSVTRQEDADPAYMTLAQASVSSIESMLSSISRLEARETRLERFAAMGALLATTLHDLRNPLNVMKGLAHIGARTTTDASERAYFEKLYKQAGTMEEMLDNLQDFGRSHKPVVESPVRIVLDVIEDLAPTCRSRRVEVEVSTPADARCLLRPALFRRVVHNVVNNALAAMPDGGVLRVRSRREPRDLVIEIEDTGPGIPEELRDILFRPFVTGRPDGSGLGLYMVHQAMVKEHEGRVWFETGKGTTFFLGLPVLPSQTDNV